MTGKNATETLLADATGIARAAAILEAGGLVAVPTETVYGLAARADSAEAVTRIYEAKGRPSFNPLIVHVRDRDHASQFAKIPEAAQRLVEGEWPGPLTLVLQARENTGLAEAVQAGLPTIALRVPYHNVMRELLARVDFPLAAPSANRSGFVSPTRAEHVLASLDGKIDCVLDGGPTARGLESTIIAINEDGSWEELRPGPVGIDMLDLLYCGREIGSDWDGDTIIRAPGQTATHYSPGKPLRLDALQAEKGEFMIGFGGVGGDCSLSEAGDLKMAARRLYDCLHQAAMSDKPGIAVAPVPQTGLGIAINDRLRRAAAG